MNGLVLEHEHDRADAASKPRRPWLAFLVGVFFPGLGHLYAGDPLRAAIAAGIVFVAITPARFLVGALLSWSAAAVIAGLVASLVMWFAIPLDGARLARHRRDRTLSAWNRVWVYVVYAVLAFVLWTVTSMWWREHLWFRTFRIPSAAMADTILLDDIVLADMRTSRLFPLRRGEIIIFEYPPEPEISYLKRVVGLPGETLELRAGHLHVDGLLLEEPYVN
jgi:signal peptidase I